MTLEQMLFAIYSAIFINIIVLMLSIYKIHDMMFKQEALLAGLLQAYMNVNKITDLSFDYKSGQFTKQK